ncbi:MAG: aminotransferase class III-fold pyridoxal phosphate-dependent enzyme, partial [Actinobacteria bacterium]|nr:aminotransferase class III-fold pyridoxal phosphate-dependent enzyme [Actinomycetota bacterium]
MTQIDRANLARLLDRERELYREQHPKSLALYQRATNLYGSVPMTWMNKWSGGFPLYFETAHGNRITDIDGNAYIDFALGDTGAMAGHSPEASVRAINSRIEKDGGKSKILVFSYCYHGSVDETFAVPDKSGRAISRPGNVAPPVPLDQTTRVVEFNDLVAVERELANGDVAAILTEPALTNIGIVLPEPGFLAGLRELATKYEALLMIDETHTFSAGFGGMTERDNLIPDIFIIGKSIGAGIPSGAFGITHEVAELVQNHPDADLVDVGGVGGTLAGNALSLAAMRATLGEVLTESAFAHMIELGDRYTEQVQTILDTYDIDWSISQIGARAEYRFTSPAPVNGSQSAHASDDELDEFMHLYMCNRGILMTPFHNMALMC